LKEKLKVHILKSKPLAISIALFLTISMCASMILLPTANAHSPPWVLTPVAYCFATPTPCGVGQSGLIYGFLNYVIQGALITNNIRFRNYHFIVTAPDNTSQTYDFATISDTTSAQFFPYTPNQEGVYTITFQFPGQVYDYGGAYNGDIYTPANDTYLWTITAEPAKALPQNPLPNNYWARPINPEQTINNA